MIDGRKNRQLILMKDNTQQYMRKACFATRLLFLVSGLGLSIWAPIVPFVKARLDLNDAELGLILLCFGVGALITMPLTGWLVHRFGSRNVTRIAAPLLVVMLPLLAIAPTPFLLSLILFLFGALEGTINVAVNAQAVAVEAKSNRPLMSGFHCLFSTGGLVGAAAMSVLLESGFDLLLSTISLAALMAIMVFSQTHHLLPSSEDIKVESQSKFVFPRGKILFYGALCFIMFLAEGAMLDWSAVFLRTEHGYETAVAGIGFAVFSVAMAIGRFTGDWLIQLFGPIKMIQTGGFLAASGLLMAVNLQWEHTELLGFLLIGFGAANIVPILFSAAGREPHTSPSVALTIVTTLGYAGLLLGPAIIGFVAQATTLSFALACLAILLIVVGLSARFVEVESTKIIKSTNN